MQKHLWSRGEPLENKYKSVVCGRDLFYGKKDQWQSCFRLNEAILKPGLGLFLSEIVGNVEKRKTGNEPKTSYEEDFVVHYSQCEAQMKLSRCYRAKLFREMDI